MASNPTASLTSAPGLRPGGRTRARVTIWFVAAEGARAAIESIRAHAFRSFLTTLGIVIGVASVIAMVSVIQGLQFMIGQQFQGLGSNSVTVQSYTALADALQGKQSRLTQYDYDLIRFRVEGISSITPIMFVPNGQATVRYGSQTTVSQVLGTSYSYQDVGQYFSSRGRFLSDSDNDTRRRVAVIGEQVRQDLSLPEDPVGEFIQINGEWLKVIGLLEAKGEILGQSQDNRVMIPYNTMVALQGRRTQPNIVVQLTLANLADLDNVRHDRNDEHREHLAARRRHRNHEHHARVRDRADARDRHLQGDRREAPSHPVAVPARGARAVPARWHRRPRNRLRTRRARGVVDSELPARPYALVGHRARDWILGSGRRRLRHLARRQGGELGSDQLVALRVGGGPWAAANGPRCSAQKRQIRIGLARSTR
jgi:hypothetical protein